MKRIDIQSAFYHNPEEILIPPSRVRRTLGSLDELKASITEHGQIHPIMVDKNHILISGERRLMSCRALEREVWAVKREDLNKEQAFELELMENVARSDLTWDEECLAISQLHAMYTTKHGEAKGKRKGWTFKKTGEKVGKSGETVRLDCYLIEMMESMPELRKFTKKNQALSALRNHYETIIEQEQVSRAVESRIHAMEDYAAQAEVASTEEFETITKFEIEEIIPGASEMEPDDLKDAIRGVLDEGITPEAVPQHKSDEEYTAEMLTHLKQGDCFELFKDLENGSVNVVLSDPPYGIDIGGSTAAGRTGVFEDPVNWPHQHGRALLEECYRVLSEHGHMYLFYGPEYYQFFIEQSREIGFDPDIIPMIWVKGNHIGRTGEPLRFPARSYESILLLHKGELPLAKRGLSNVLIHTPVRGEDKIHETEKPVSLYKDLIGRSAYPGFTILDPMAGSASSIEAALDLGYKAIGFEIGEEKHSKSILRLARWAKSKDAQLKFSLENDDE